ncbi:ABC transporter, ATP-binding protein, partial [Streptomyces ipomoeae 91-03]
LGVVHVPLLARGLDRPGRRAPCRAGRHPGAVAAPGQHVRAGPHPLRWQPAEGRPRPLAAARLQGAAARRADPGRRRGRPRRAVRGRTPPRRRGTGRTAGLQ